MAAELIVVYLVLVGVVVLIANVRGLSRGTALGVSLVLSPLIGFLWVAFARPHTGPLPAGPTWGETTCRHCGATRPPGARTCPNCGKV